MFAAFVLRPFCSHRDSIIKVDEKHRRVYTECIKCLHRSPGISTAKALHVPSRRISTQKLNRMLEGRNAQ